LIASSPTTRLFQQRRISLSRVTTAPSASASAITFAQPSLRRLSQINPIALREIARPFCAALCFRPAVERQMYRCSIGI
jgi:hypothetical protein